MSEYVTKIRTDKGDKQIDYNALANLPIIDETLSHAGQLADAKAVGDGLAKKANTTHTHSVADIGAASASHKHSAADITSGTLPVTRGGTGATTHTSNAVLTGNGTSAVKNVATASGALYATSANGAATFGTLPIEQGGTGATSAANARSKLGVAAASHNHSASNITSGTLPISRGGTGVTTESDLRTRFGLSLPKKNLLDNWYLDDPINQRGNSSLDSEGYFIDRWQFGKYNNNHEPSTTQYTFINVHGGIALRSYSDPGKGNSTFLRQYIDNPSRFSGETVTLSAKINYSEVNGTPRLMIYAKGDTVVNEYYPLKNDELGIISVTAKLPGNITELWVGIGNFNSHGGTGNFYINIKSMKLEVGGVSTLNDDEPPKKSEQLLECQRYYVKFPGNNAYPGYRGVSGSPCASIQLPVPLRTNNSEMIDVQFGEVNGKIYNSITPGCTVGYDKSNIAVKEYGGGNSLMVEFKGTYSTDQCPSSTALNFVCKDLEISADLK